ncbi:MAG: cupin domain-containing protein [Tannerellaceae bacterium]|jgi:mannose-6-phosphate isomerase-like protein (cupin superfamily)|nr:cupin domain-containing protein [Tannerellaceae bacterium]
MRKSFLLSLGLLFCISLDVLSQKTVRAVPGNIESYIDRFEESRVNRNRNGWAHYYIPPGMGDTLTVKMSCVYEGTQTHAPHSHNEDEAFYIVRGPVNFHINGEERVFNAGDFIYTPSKSSHNIQRVNNDTIKYLVIKRETVKAVDTPHKAGKSDYTMDDCSWLLSGDPAWNRPSNNNYRTVAVNKEFADGFQIVKERVVDNDKVYSNKNTSFGGQMALYVISGNAEVTLDGKKAALSADNTFYSPKNTSYSFRKTGTDPLVFLMITTE